MSSGENQFLPVCSLETIFLLHAPDIYYFIRRETPEKSIIGILIKPITYNVFITFSEKTQYLANSSEEFSPWRDFVQLLSQDLNLESVNELQRSLVSREIIGKIIAKFVYRYIISGMRVQRFYLINTQRVLQSKKLTDRSSPGTSLGYSCTPVPVVL